MLRFGLGGLSDRTFGVLRPTLYPSGYDWACPGTGASPSPTPATAPGRVRGQQVEHPSLPCRPGVERPLDDLLVLSRTHAASSSFGPSRRPRGWTNLLSRATLLRRCTHR